ncbi:Putative cyclase [Pseudonocardia thermophila]|jgi:Predicted metal-dependent hydrolase|uniref:Putative cyclase n=1 Tax=Pseudonocardia thermophila TaxID=1848 RepID=A0A1M6T3Q1_PSETH|nr:cyclase family protein [Pseudonocardia thermophila]SHK51587.1 Putative cyclase [Pseudonocardia thermophila]
MTIAGIPDHAELSQRTDAPPGSAWGLFGPDDQLGTLNFLTEERTAAAARLIRRGATFNLDYPLNTFVPSLAGTRPATEHHIFSNNPNHRDDWLDSFYLQSTSQVDGLRHIRHPRHGFYGGVPDEAIAVGTPDLGIQLLAEKAIAGRGVLLDAVSYFESIGEPLEFTTMVRLTPEHLDAIAEHCRVTIEPGDIVLLRTGFAEEWVRRTPEQRAEPREGGTGLDQSDAMLAWLWDHRIALMASDNAGLESYPVNPASGWIDPDEPPPPRGPSHNGMLHRPMLALLGMVIGELWKLDELAADCAADGRYEFFLTVKPLNLVGGVGSPPNAIAVK